MKIDKDFKKRINSHYQICYSRKGAVTTQTKGQGLYFETVDKNDVVFCNGPAGTGKTFLAVCFAISALEKNLIDRIVLCRPAVEAGENLGFLPGDLKEKVDPYLAPLYDALNVLLEEKKLIRLLENKIIEIVPLAYMRGRTLDNSFMILDEAQNATITQMKMFLTRLGVGSKSIITGDVTQIDLNPKEESGLVQVTEVLKDIKGIGFVKLNQNDVVRHHLVKKIIPCVESYPIIMNNETNKASGYVLPYYSRKNIYINNNHWPMLDIYSKSHLIIHECTHLTLDTDDYAYDYQDKLFSLRGSHALHNADTITSIICALSYYNKH